MMSKVLVDGIAKFQCATCGKLMAEKRDMKRHLESHLDVSYACEICKKVCTTSNALRKHYYMHHRHWPPLWCYTNKEYKASLYFDSIFPRRPRCCNQWYDVQGRRLQWGSEIQMHRVPENHGSKTPYEEPHRNSYVNHSSVWSGRLSKVI